MKTEPKKPKLEKPKRVVQVIKYTPSTRRLKDDVGFVPINETYASMRLG